MVRVFFKKREGVLVEASKLVSGIDSNSQQTQRGGHVAPCLLPFPSPPMFAPGFHMPCPPQDAAAPTVSCKLVGKLDWPLEMMSSGA